MRRILSFLGIIVLSAALSGCFWPPPWHDHGGGGGGYHHGGGHGYH